MKFIGILLLFLYAGVISAQEKDTVLSRAKKTVEALSISAPITIDGVLDEPAYAQAQAARDFMQLQPYNGRPAYQPSDVFILYDQTALYVGAMLYDSSPDSIYNFFSERDNIGMSDYFGIYFDPYNQGQLAYGFFITPAGVQVDIKASKSEHDYEDSNWDAVWQSKTTVTDNGWIVEMRIPYSALRFPENGGGTWGLNMFRNIRRYNSNSSWNFIDREVSGFIHQEGQITGITNIKPPVRLSLSPYAAAYAEFNEGTSSPDFTYKGGMDLKYGISEAFTLDMMLIPDFGQIQSDDKQLNLSPYELYYSEKRQFFTEGTELFDRANVFYSRRIGATPKYSYKAYSELKDNEVVHYNPTETQLLNATKVSGRTTKGWGLGMLNAMTLPSHATLKDTITGQERDVKVQPFTNYNVTVIDKSLKNNSYFSLINTNIMMVKDTFLINDPLRANVTATDFQIRNKAKTIAVKGKGGVSFRRNGEQQTGYFAGLGVEKNSGKLVYGISQSIYSDKFNPNDLGYLQRNNEMETETYIRYNIVEPFGIFREVHSALFWDHTRMYRNASLFTNEIGFDTYAQFKNNYGVEVFVEFTGNKYDYYEPRVTDRFYFEPPRWTFNLFGFTDNRKAWRISGGIGGYTLPDTDQSGYFGNGYARLRIGRRFVMEYEMYGNHDINDRGFTDMTSSSDTIYFARRDVRTIQSVIGTSYAFNNKAGLDLRIRHYWSGVINKDYHQLQPDGTLVHDPAYLQNMNENYNAFNIDLVFRWIFAPGSELSVAWKNSILDSRDRVTENYFENLGRTWKSDQTNSLSIKVLYYIDYNNLRKKK
jgi:hypothetical protein